MIKLKLFFKKLLSSWFFYALLLIIILSFIFSNWSGWQWKGWDALSAIALIITAIYIYRQAVINKEIVELQKWLGGDFLGRNPFPILGASNNNPNFPILLRINF